MINNRGAILTSMTIFLICVFIVGGVGALLTITYNPKLLAIGNIAVIALLSISRDIRMIIFVGIPVNIMLIIALLLS